MELRFRAGLHCSWPLVCAPRFLLGGTRIHRSGCKGCSGVSLQHGKRLCKAPAGSSFKALLQSLQGSCAGTASELSSLTSLLSKYLSCSFAIVCPPLSAPKITSEHLQNRMRGNQFSREKWHYRNTPQWSLLLLTK